MTTEEIIKKLIGPIRPVGETNEDERRLENQKEFSELATKIIMAINEVERENRGAMEYSRKKAHDYAKSWLNETQNFLIGR